MYHQASMNPRMNPPPVNYRPMTFRQMYQNQLIRTSQHHTIPFMRSGVPIAGWQNMYPHHSIPIYQFCRPIFIMRPALPGTVLQNGQQVVQYSRRCPFPAVVLTENIHTVPGRLNNEVRIRGDELMTEMTRVNILGNMPNVQREPELVGSMAQRTQDHEELPAMLQSRPSTRSENAYLGTEESLESHVKLSREHLYNKLVRQFPVTVGLLKRPTFEYAILEEREKTRKRKMEHPIAGPPEKIRASDNTNC